MLNCTRCDLHKTRKNIVIMRGDPDPDIVLIGEAPGRDEDEQGLPFVGRSGKLLDEALTKSGITKFAIINILKCRPPQNRKPSIFEVKMCSPWFETQLLNLSPILIVCMGATAFNYFVPVMKISEGIKRTTESLEYMKVGNLKVCAVFHPSYVLRGSLSKEEYFDMFKKINIICGDIKGRDNE